MLLQLLRLAFVLAVSGWASCAAAPMDAVRDLAAIHTDDDWRPRSPASMTLPPDWYLHGARSLDVPKPGTYEVADHRALELAILDRVGAVDPAEPAPSLEATAWLLTVLRHDDHAAARVKAAAILSQFAGFWIESRGARLPAGPLDGDLSAALRALDAAPDAAAFRDALPAFARVALPAPTDTIRLVAGLGRSAVRHGVTAGHSSAEALFTLGARAVVQALEAGAADADPEVAAACRARAELLLRFAAPQ